MQPVPTEQGIDQGSGASLGIPPEAGSHLRVRDGGLEVPAGLVDHLRGIIQKFRDRFLLPGTVLPPAPHAFARVHGAFGVHQESVGDVELVAVDDHVFRGGVGPVKPQQQVNRPVRFQSCVAENDFFPVPIGLAVLNRHQKVRFNAFE